MDLKWFLHTTLLGVGTSLSLTSDGYYPGLTSFFVLGELVTSPASTPRNRTTIARHILSISITSVACIVSVSLLCLFIDASRKLSLVPYGAPPTDQVLIWAKVQKSLIPRHSCLHCICIPRLHFIASQVFLISWAKQNVGNWICWCKITSRLFCKIICC